MGGIEDKRDLFWRKIQKYGRQARQEKTIIAQGHNILIAAYYTIKEKMPYKEPGEDHLNNFRRDKLVASHNKQLANLGEEAF